MGGMGDMGAGGSMDMGSGVPSLFYLQQMYWAVVGAAIGAFTLVNAYSWFLCWQRLRSTSKTPAKPRNFAFVGLATITAILRELSNATLPAFALKRWRLPTPTFGRTAIVLANVVILVVLCFYKLDTSDYYSFEDIGYRTGFITICQLPLLFLLAGKRNIIGALTGSSYERINWLHRWASRCMLLTATIHMGYWFADWAPYDYINAKIAEDPITKRGVAAWAILLWITFSSMTPIRGLCYEFFVVQHIISFAAFIGMVYVHTPTEVHVYIWICVGLFFADRLARGFYYMYNNLSLLHPEQRQNGSMGKLWSMTAEFSPLSGNTTRITICNPPISWRPGQHVFLSAHSLAPLQAHPFTISTLPSDGKMEFLVQSQKGGTRRMHRHAQKIQMSLPSTTTDVSVYGRKSVSIEGPYGRIRPLRQFDSVVLLAGSTGATFTMPLLRDLVQSWRRSCGQSRPRGGMWLSEGAVTRHVKFAWVLKSGAQLSWFSDALGQVVEDVKALREDGYDVAVDISVYITCDDTFTTEQKSLLAALQSRAPAPQNLTHGRVEELADAAAALHNTDTSDEKGEKGMGKRDIETDRFSVREVDSDTQSDPEANPTDAKKATKTCGPNGTCCCTAAVDESDPDAIARVVCTCNCSHASSSSSASPSRTDSSASLTLAEAGEKGEKRTTRTGQKKPLLHPSIALYSGRPQPREIIRRSLEQAQGESAVVVCGPKGLVDGVRSSVVGLSDERAVHKGTGAQGVWLHTEAFGY